MDGAHWSAPPDTREMVEISLIICGCIDSFRGDCRAADPAAMHTGLWCASSGGPRAVRWGPGGAREDQWRCLCSESHEQDSAAQSRACKVSVVKWKLNKGVIAFPFWGFYHQIACGFCASCSTATENLYHCYSFRQFLQNKTVIHYSHLEPNKQLLFCRVLLSSIAIS